MDGAYLTAGAWPMNERFDAGHGPGVGAAGCLLGLLPVIGQLIAGGLYLAQRKTRTTLMPALLHVDASTGVRTPLACMEDDAAANRLIASLKQTSAGDRVKEDDVPAPLIADGDLDQGLRIDEIDAAVKGDGVAGQGVVRRRRRQKAAENDAAISAADSLAAMLEHLYSNCSE